MIEAMVLGGHGDTMVPLTSCTSVAGIPVSQLLPPARLEEMVRRVRDGGAGVAAARATGPAPAGT